MSQWLRLFAIVLAVAVPHAAAAQPHPSPSREQAIRMLVAGDHQGAAKVLEPLAQDSSKPDPAAQFLLAILYDTGEGVPRNAMRACGLYRQAGSATSPFMQQAAELGRMLHEDSPIPGQMCSPGPWHDLPEATVTLGAGHTVQFTANTIVVRYRDREQRVGTGTLPGAIPLPIIHTPLDVTQPVRERRHFLQSFIWVPDNAVAPSSWTLGWILNEIAGAEFVPITGERSLLTVTAERPPSAVDLLRLATVRVGASGQPEWIIPAGGGENVRTAAVPRRERP